MRKVVTKKNIYLLGLLVISLLGLILTPTYAHFGQAFTTTEDVVGMSLTFDLGISNIEEYEEIVVNESTSEIFNVEISNLSGSTAYYGIWYKMVVPSEQIDGIEIARLEGSSTTTSGSISSSGSTTVTIVVINHTNESVKINIGVASSTTSTSDIEYLGGKYLISDSVSDAANPPNLDDGHLIPVYYDETNEVWKKADSNNKNNRWYDYSNKEWANAILVKDSTTSTAIDKSGHGNDGTISGATLTNEGLSFDGVDDYIVVDSLEYNSSKAITIDLVAKVEENDVAILLESSENANNNYGGYFIDTNERGTNDYLFTFRGSSGYNIKLKNNIITTTNFKHYTVTFNTGKSFNNFINMYFDGKNETLETTGEDSLTTDISNNAITDYPLYIASRAGTSHFAKMTIKHLRIYNRELNASEITSNHNGNVIENGLILNYDFTDGMNTKRNYYEKADPDIQINEDDILGFYVWIPRYKYHVWNITRQAGAESTYAYSAFTNGIDIQFEGGTSSTGNVECTYDVTTVESETTLSDTCIYNDTTTITTTSGNTNYTDAWYTHPAFTFGTEEKTGFWIGKFETTGSASAPTVLPDSTALVSQNVSEQFTSSKVFQTYGLSSNIDAHMLTNLEWGAIAYLTHSIYGLCDGTSCRDVYINNSSSLYTGRSGGAISGSDSLQLTNFYGSSITTSTEMYNANGYYNYKGYKIDNSGTITSTKDISKVASTTGNITGVYDISGGSIEYVMGNMVDSTGAFYPSSSGTDWNGSTTLSLKYYNSYSYSSSNYNGQIAFNRARLGDGTGEVTGISSSNNSWQPGVTTTGANSAFVTDSTVWFARGGYSKHTNSGIFFFGRAGGGKSSSSGTADFVFRSSLS